VAHPLRIGAAIPPYGPAYDDVRRAALAAEVAGGRFALDVEIERTVLLEEHEVALAAENHEAGMTHLIVTLSAPRYDTAQVDRLRAWRARVAV
jgi:hypothetical protein